MTPEVLSWLVIGVIAYFLILLIFKGIDLGDVSIEPKRKSSGTFWYFMGEYDGRHDAEN